MTDELKIFGKVMTVHRNGQLYMDRLGLFDFAVYELNGVWKGSINDGFAVGESETKEAARDLIESEARRIMRECLEIATGPVLVGTTQPPTDDCVVITTDEQYRELYGKPMPKVWTGSGKKTIPLPFADTNDCEDPDD